MINIDILHTFSDKAYTVNLKFGTLYLYLEFYNVQTAVQYILYRCIVLLTYNLQYNIYFKKIIKLQQFYTLFLAYFDIEIIKNDKKYVDTAAGCSECILRCL